MILASAILFGWVRLDVGLYYDEAYTLTAYAVQPPAQICTDYSAPNNHIANSLMLHAWSRVIGDPTLMRPDVWIYRIPAVLCFTLGVLAFFAAALRLVDPDPVMAAAATAFFACQSHALEYAGALRGYGPSLALMCVLLARVAWVSRTGPLRFGCALAVLVFLLDYLVPSNVWFTVTGGLAVLIAARRGKEPADRPPFAISIAALGAGFLATGLAYWPVREQLKAFAGERGPLFDRLLGHLALFLSEVGYGLPLPLTLFALSVGFVVILRRAAAGCPYAHRTALLALPVVLGCVPFAAVLSNPGFARNYLPAHACAALVHIWAVIGVAGFLRQARPVAIGAMLTIALGSGLLHAFTHQSDRQADRVVAFLRPVVWQGAVVVVGEDAELAAHRYYAAALKLPVPLAYYQGFAAKDMNRTPEVWFLTSTTKELEDILKHFGIPQAVWLKHGNTVGKIGRIHIGVLTMRTLPASLGARKPAAQGTAGVRP